VDGYAGFDKLFNARPPVVFEVGCWSHARRKYVDALEGGDVRAAVGISIIGKLFEVEREADAAGLDHEARRVLRSERSNAILDELGRWVAQAHAQAPPKSPLGQALIYTVNQWQQLRRFLEDGRPELTNNGVERALRAIAVGRANWLFAGSDTGAGTIINVAGDGRGGYGILAVADLDSAAAGDLHMAGKSGMSMHFEAVASA